jgi:precorrin-3B C17-methyltransferase
MVTPEVTAALAAATDVLGYAPYVARVPARPGLTLHPSDNREELARAAQALALARAGRRVVVVSGGDPGVFAMASAVFEAIAAEQDGGAPLPEVQVLPGVTAMLAAAAAAGAPLGHDFCAINLSDNLKPQALIDHRLRLAVEADFAIAMYNPRSASRPEGFGHVLEVLRKAGAGQRLMILARNVSRPDQTLRILPLAEVTAEMADMRTLVILCNGATRRVGPFVYAPRSVP